MAVSRALRRLLRVLNLEEEQRKLALESSLVQLSQLERAAAATGEQARAGRRLVSASAQSGELPDRLAGLEEVRSAGRRSLALAPRIEQAQLNAESSRQAFLAKRIEARQVETLISEAAARDAIEDARRSQQSLDNLYLNQMHGGSSSSPQSLAASSAPSTPDDSAQQSHGLKRANLSDSSPKTDTGVLNRETRSQF